MMRDKLGELILQFDPEVRTVVAEVIGKEREYLDMMRPRGIMDDIEDIIDRVARHGESGGMQQ